MRRRLIKMRLFGLVALTAICVALAGSALLVPPAAHAASPTCATKHCARNTHCCYGCTANPICVRNGVPCPECAPQ
jgi:hypothetical protein